jgi:pyruvate phosphate dikinase-like enzyme
MCERNREQLLCAPNVLAAPEVIREAGLGIAFAIGDPTSFELTSRNEAGSKAANLHDIAKMGFPVPFSFNIVTSEDIRARHKLSPREPLAAVDSHLINAVFTHMEIIEQKSGLIFGDSGNPLLVSVRSGARVSMPGMMDTVLNIGLNDKTVEGLTQQIGEHAAKKTYYEFLITFAVNILGIESDEFSEVVFDEVGSVEKWQQQIFQVKNIIKDNGKTFPQNPWTQLFMAIESVWRSAQSPEALNYIKQGHLDEKDPMTTAVTVMQMVFGNNELVKNDPQNQPGSAVILTKGINDGDVTFAPFSQGDRVVGDEELITMPISQLPWPEEVKRRLREHIGILHERSRFPKDLEIVYTGDPENGLYFLQFRNYKDAAAFLEFFALQLRLEEVDLESIISLISVSDIRSLFRHGLNQQEIQRVLKHEPERLLIKDALVANQGNASGEVIFDPNEIPEDADKEQTYILALEKIEDIHRFMPLDRSIVGIIAKNGSKGSHNTRILETISKIPSIMGVGEDGFTVLRKYKGQDITLDASYARVFAGIIPRDEKELGSSLSPKAIELGKRIVEEVRKNPWQWVAGGQQNLTEVERVKNEVGAILEKSQKAYSLKGKETQALIAIAQPNGKQESLLDIRIQNRQIIPTTPEHRTNNFTRTKLVKKLAKKIAWILENGDHVSIRTCHHPQRDASGPWTPVTCIEDLKAFLYGEGANVYERQRPSLANLLADNDLTEIIISPVQKGELDLKNSPEYAIAALSINPFGVVTLELAPNTSNTRIFEDIKREDMMSLIMSFAYDTKILSQYKGKNVANNPHAMAMWDAIRKVFSKHNVRKFAKYLAAMQSLFPTDEHRNIVMEVVLHLPNPNKPEEYTLTFHGIKADFNQSDQEALTA